MLKCFILRFSFAFNLFIYSWWIFVVNCSDWKILNIVSFNLFTWFSTFALKNNLFHSSKPLVRWRIRYLQVKFGICDLTMTILMKRWLNSALNYKIGLICENDVNATWWILEDVRLFWYQLEKSILSVSW